MSSGLTWIGHYLWFWHLTTSYSAQKCDSYYIAKYLLYKSSATPEFEIKCEILTNNIIQPVTTLMFSFAYRLAMGLYPCIRRSIYGCDF